MPVENWARRKIRHRLDWMQLMTAIGVSEQKRFRNGRKIWRKRKMIRRQQKKREVMKLQKAGEEGNEETSVVDTLYMKQQ